MRPRSIAVVILSPFVVVGAWALSVMLHEPPKHSPEMVAAYEQHWESLRPTPGTHNAWAEVCETLVFVLDAVHGVLPERARELPDGTFAGMLGAQFSDAAWRQVHLKGSYQWLKEEHVQRAALRAVMEGGLDEHLRAHLDTEWCRLPLDRIGFRDCRLEMHLYRALRVLNDVLCLRLEEAWRVRDEAAVFQTLAAGFRLNHALMSTGQTTCAAAHSGHQQLLLTLRGLIDSSSAPAPDRVLAAASMALESAPELPTWEDSVGLSRIWMLQKIHASHTQQGHFIPVTLFDKNLDLQAEFWARARNFEAYMMPSRDELLAVFNDAWDEMLALPAVERTEDALTDIHDRALARIISRYPHAESVWISTYWFQSYATLFPSRYWVRGGYSPPAMRERGRILTTLIIEMERTCRRTRSYPRTLIGVLDPSSEKRPMDPYSKTPFLMEPARDGYVIYLIGPDMIDHGGSRLKDEVLYVRGPAPWSIW